MLLALESPRLILREVQLEDGPELQRFETLEEYTRLQAVEPSEFTDGRQRIERYFEHRGAGAKRRMYVFSAICRVTETIIGQFGLTLNADETATLGLGVAPDQWGKGYGTEIAKSAIAYGFDTLKLKRIKACVATEHLACCRILEKAGMVQISTAKDCIWAQGRWWSEFNYAIEAKRNAAL